MYTIKTQTTASVDSAETLEIMLRLPWQLETILSVWNLRVDFSNFPNCPPKVDSNHDGHDDEEEDHNSKNDTNDHDKTWLYKVINDHE